MSAVTAPAAAGDAVPSFSSLAERRQEISTMYDGYKAGFPEVMDITAAEVKVLLEQGDPVILVDVRTDEEHSVSMIEGALTKAAFEKDKEQHEGDAIITYCTAGARSGKYAAQLGKEGFTNVRNMKGSLVSWTHEGLPVVDSSGQPTKKVHAFGPKWQALYASEYDSVVFQNPTLKVATEAVKGAWSSVFGSKS